jgi:hypothetical protein
MKIRDNGDLIGEVMSKNGNGDGNDRSFNCSRGGLLDGSMVDVEFSVNVKTTVKDLHHQNTDHTPKPRYQLKTHNKAKRVSTSIKLVTPTK